MTRPLTAEAEARLDALRRSVEADAAYEIESLGGSSFARLPDMLLDVAWGRALRRLCPNEADECADLLGETLDPVDLDQCLRVTAEVWQYVAPRPAQIKACFSGHQLVVATVDEASGFLLKSMRRVAP